MLVLLAIVVAAPVFAQVPPIDQAPPVIAFPDWKEIPTDENSSEFSVSFPSAITSKYPENNVVPVRFLLPAQHDRPLPVVIILHYWGATDLSIERELAGELNDRDIAAAIVTLPYHLARTPAGYRSGQLAIQADPAQLVVTMTQSVMDVRRTIDFIQTRTEFDHKQLGISGTSLGSLVSILSYAIDPRLSKAAFMLGGIDLADIVWHSSRVVKVREELRRRGYTENRLRRELASIEPAAFLAKRTTGSAFVIGGKYDTVIPPVDTTKLINALPGAKTLWLDTGHYGGVFVEKRILRTVADYFEKQFQGQNFVPPFRLYAPTLRIGALVNTESGLQVGAGIDLFKAGKHGEFFSTLIATPKGLNLFAGVSVGHGFALGGFASRKKLSAGLWWSTVL
jgi:dienelactone hydrolase